MAENDYLWDPAAEPDAEIVRLEQALRPLRHRGEARLPEPLPRRGTRRRAAWVAAAAVVAAIGVGIASRLVQSPWTVTALRGRVMAGGAPVASGGGADVLRAGEWVETGAGSAARIRVGRIGRADLGPGSRARVVRARGAEHRMALERGTLHARIDAPPRFFLVETPGALAVDLGCVYTLTLDARGTGVLRVESGKVELARGGRTSVVYAGNEAAMAPGMGPGLPYPVGADSAFRRAVRRYDQVGDSASLAALIGASGRGSTITLWHLLQRVSARDRPLVYDRLATFAPAPAGASRDATLALDPRALRAWRRALQATWTSEKPPFYERIWRAAAGVVGG